MKQTLKQILIMAIKDCGKIVLDRKDLNEGKFISTLQTLGSTVDEMADKKYLEYNIEVLEIKNNKMFKVSINITKVNSLEKCIKYLK